MSVQGGTGYLQCGLMLKSATHASVFSIDMRHAESAFRMFCFGAGGFRVQRACSGSSLGLWGCVETLSTESTVFVAKGMDGCDRFSCSTSLCSMLYKEAQTLQIPVFWAWTQYE